MSNSANSTIAGKSLEDWNRLLDEQIREETCISKFASTHHLLNPETGQVLPINCKSPRCPKHAGRWLHKWKVIVSRETAINPVDKLITLTCAETATPEQLCRARQLLFRSIRKEQAIEYISVLEFTTRTRLPHLHILARSSYIPQNLLSELWASATRAANIKPSPIVYIEKPRDQKAASVYALSYALNGEAKGQDIPKDWHGRKISYSRNFFVAASPREHWLSWIRETFGEKPEGDTWVVRPDYIPVLARRELGWGLPE